MPLPRSTRAVRVATSSLRSYISTSRIPLRICSSCRAQLAIRNIPSIRSLSSQSRLQHASTLSCQRSKYTYPALSRRYATSRYSINPEQDRIIPQDADGGGVSNGLDSNQLYSSDAPTAPPSRRLVVLQMPAMHESLGTDSGVQFDKDLFDSLAQTLQTFEFEVSSDQVPTEIQLFKPSILRVSKSRFNQLAKEMSAAFLGPQIKEYLQTVAGSIKSEIPITKMKKKDAINAVLREVWKVEVAEEIAAEMDVIRERELSFDTMELFFMMAEGGQMLQKLATKNRTRIVLNSQNNSLLLKGTKPSLDRVEKSLQSLSRRIISEEFDLAPLLRVGKLNEAYIPSISRLTNTYVERGDGEKIILNGILPYGSSNILDAKRLIFNSLDLHFRETYSLLSETEATESLTGALYPVMEHLRLPWMYRGREWYRWRGIRRPKPPAEEEDEDLEAMSMKLDSELTAAPLILAEKGANVNYTDIRQLLDSPSSSVEIDPPSDTIDSSTDLAKPTAGRYTTYHAILGQILHSPQYPTPSTGPPSSIRGGPQSLSAFLSTFPSHILCNSVPGIVDFLSTLNPLTASYDFRILLKFSPSPWSNPQNFDALPHVEMDLLIDPNTNELKEIKIYAIEGVHTADILMPRNQLDLRFVKRTAVELSTRTEEVRRYIMSAQLDVLGEDRLTAGEELVLQLPKWLIRSRPNDNIHSPAPAAKPSRQDDVDDELDFSDDWEFRDEAPRPSRLDNPVEVTDDDSPTAPVTYYFTALETRSSATFDFRGAPLVYTKIEAGASGGSYDEVLLECNKHEIEYLTPLEEQEEHDKLKKEIMRANGMAEDDDDDVLRHGKSVGNDWLARIQQEKLEQDAIEAAEKERADGASEDLSEAELIEPPETLNEERKNPEFDMEKMMKLERENQKALAKSVEKLEALIKTYKRAEKENQDDEQVGPQPSEQKDPSLSDNAVAAGSDTTQTDAEGGISEAKLTDDQPQPTNPADFSFLLRGETDDSNSSDADLFGKKSEQSPLQVTRTGARRSNQENPDITEEEEEEEEDDYISDEVFNRFVNTSRKLVEAVETVESAKKQRRKL